MKSKQEQVIELLAKHDCKITNATHEGFSRAVEAIYNTPPAPKRDHNSLKVTENTPKGTLLLGWRDPEYKEPVWFSHISKNGNFMVWQTTNFDEDPAPMEHAERYIGQHFIPWDAEQSDGKPPCEGRVIIQFADGETSTIKDAKLTVPWNHWTKAVKGYLPITDTGEIDWERVPR